MVKVRGVKVKTIAEVAREFGVTPKTIYKRLNQVKPGGTQRKDGITYVTGEGMEYLTAVLTEGITRLNLVKEDNEEVQFLREQVKELQEELKTERAHSREIAERLAQIMENQQKLIGIEKMPLIEDKKKGWFGFLRRVKE